MSKPTAYVQIDKITSDRQEAEEFDGYAWDTDSKTFRAFYDAKKKYSVPFKEALIRP